MRKIIALSLLGILFNLYSFAQSVTEKTAIKPIMEQEGKIYVVLFVCLVVLGGLISYLFILDKRISQMEKEKK